MYWVSKDNNGWYLVVQGQYLRQRLILDRTGTSSTTAGKYHHLVKTREESDCDDYERALRQNTLSKWFQDQKQNIQTHEHLFHERIMNFFTESLIVRRTKDDLTESGNLTWEKHNKSQYEPQLKLKTNSRLMYSGWCTLTQSTNEKFSSLSPHHSFPICCLLSGPMYNVQIKMKDQNMMTTHQRQQHDTRSWCQYGLDRRAS